MESWRCICRSHGPFDQTNPRTDICAQTLWPEPCANIPHEEGRLCNGHSGVRHLHNFEWVRKDCDCIFSRPDRVDEPAVFAR